MMKFVRFLVKWMSQILWLVFSLLIGIASIVGVNVIQANMWASANEQAPEATYQYHYELWAVNPPIWLIGLGIALFMLFFFGGRLLFKNKPTALYK